MIFISQPTYLPWIGYFSFISQCEKVVFLDDVQFARRSWQQRNKIIKKNDYEYLTVPVKKSGQRNQLIKDVEIFDKNFFEKHLTIIKFNYSKCKYFKRYFSEFEKLKSLIEDCKFLSEINILLITRICYLLNINLNYTKSSEINTVDNKAKKLFNICEKLSANIMLANEGSKNYIEEEIDIFNEKNIKIIFQRYNCPIYTQRSEKFLKYLSIIDLLFNEGPNSINFINSGIEEIK
jgi:hypothetical protein